MRNQHAYLHYVTRNNHEQSSVNYTLLNHPHRLLWALYEDIMGTIHGIWEIIDTRLTVVMLGALSTMADKFPFKTDLIQLIYIIGQI